MVLSVTWLSRKVCVCVRGCVCVCATSSWTVLVCAEHPRLQSVLSAGLPIASGAGGGSCLNESRARTDTATDTATATDPDTDTDTATATATATATGTSHRHRHRHRHTPTHTHTRTHTQTHTLGHSLSRVVSGDLQSHAHLLVVTSCTLGAHADHSRYAYLSLIMPPAFF